jgi:predicted ATP-dependent endonuclease of OLD family
MVALRLSGYRRFERETTLDLTPRVVAIVGPNEAGKSSVLNALGRLGGPIEAVDLAQSEFTARKVPEDEKVILSALFELDDEDSKALAEVPGAEEIRHWLQERTADGLCRASILPRLERDHSRRDAAVTDIGRMLDNRSRTLVDFLLRPQKTDDEADEESDELRTVRGLAEEVSASLSSPEENLDEDSQTRLDELALELEGAPPGAPKYVKELSGVCRKIIEEHREEHPGDRAWAILNARCPEVKVMRDDDRELHSSYLFEDYSRPPAPLENLLVLAGLDWADLKEAASQAHNPLLADMIRNGNSRLEDRLSGAWNQSKVSIKLQEQAGELNVYPYDAESRSHSLIEDRSDGFRSFLALLTFTARHSSGERRLILAIDEAELHLHYNAQADLVKVLTRQDLVTQIIYTTHSAGCLPEDVGSAIRVVRQEPDDRSTIENGFWSARDKESPAGFTSLLMAMGADAVAFTPARHAVITEGPSDALLLPALIREALGSPPDYPLGIQVAGGLAWTPPKRLHGLDAEAAHVVYLADSDRPGQEYRSELYRAGVDKKRVFVLRAGSTKGLTIEDFVHKATYASVVNFLLRKIRAYEGPSLTPKELPTVGASRAIERWCASRGLEPISKTAIAEHLLRVCGANLAYIYWDPEDEKTLPLLRANRKKAIVRLYKELRSSLGLTGNG